MADKHTPGKMEIGTALYGRVFNPSLLSVVTAGERRFIAEVYGIADLHCTQEEAERPACCDEGLANAERIRLCWNSHEALVEALEGLARPTHGYPEPHWCDCSHIDKHGNEGPATHHSEWCDNARAALALAKGEA